MNTDFYLPILKSKLGEFTALGHLSENSKDFITPLFEITPLEWDQAERKIPRTLTDHLDSFCKKLLSKWPTSNCFIDPELLKWDRSDNRDQVRYVFDKLAEKDVVPAPVVSLEYSQSFLEALKGTIQTYKIKEVGFRVTPNHVTDADFPVKVQELLDQLRLKPAQVHMILDLADSNFGEIENFADAIASVLESFPFIDGWKSITVAGTAFPSSRIIKEGVSYFPRNDWMVYKKLLEKLKAAEFKRRINYGDYSIVNPAYFEFKPKVMKSSANIRYTLDDKWMVVKGTALKKSADYLQYKKLAKSIVASVDYLGEDFSMGDLHLARCVRGVERPGAPSVWNWVGNNHHFEKVLNDIAAMHHAV